MIAYNIIWDVDDSRDLDYLPSEIVIPEEYQDEDEISDYITEFTGFCHKGFALKSENRWEALKDGSTTN